MTTENNIKKFLRCIIFLIIFISPKLSIWAQETSLSDEFKHTIDSKDYANWFPDLTKIELPDESYDAKNADDYVRNSYRGGWCYLVKGKETK